MPVLPPVHITGSIRTRKIFNEEIEIESELKSMLESNDLVETAKVSVTGIKKGRRNSHESNEYVVKIVEFIAVCFVRNQTQLDMIAIRKVQQSLMQSIETSEPFSLANKPLVVDKPKIIKIIALPIANETEIEKKIGKSKTKSDNTIALPIVSNSSVKNQILRSIRE